MKKLMCLLLPLILFSCSQSDPVIIPDTIDFKRFIQLVNLPSATVKSSLTGKPSSEKNTLGIVELGYLYPTKECNYYIGFKFTLDDRLSSITIIDASNKSKIYSDGINFNKVLSDRIENNGGWISYSGFYYGMYPFNKRVDYWSYLINHSVTYSASEIWTLEDKTITLLFLASDNTSSIIIEKK